MVIIKIRFSSKKKKTTLVEVTRFNLSLIASLVHEEEFYATPPQGCSEDFEEIFSFGKKIIRGIRER